MKNMMTFLKDESGASAAEYALLVSLIAVVIVAGITAVGTKILAKFNSVATSLT